MLKQSLGPLHAEFDLAMLDLDGVVYRGAPAVPGAPEHLAAARRAGLPLAFITNNSSRTPEVVASHLSGLGVPARPADVVTSGQAATRLLRSLVHPGARVLLLGGPGLELALRDQGFEPVTEASESPDAVVSGYGPDLRWGRIVQAATQIRAGLPWVATNADLTFPTDLGIGPGHGALVRLIQDFSGVVPHVAGKPERPLLDETIARFASSRALMVGDRLDTDIRGARRAGIASMLVLTGVTGLRDLVAASAEDRPTYVSVDLRGLVSTHDRPGSSSQGHTSGGWRAAVDGARLSVAGQGSADQWWRCASAAAWAYLDRTGQVVDVTGVTPPS